jgi:hypothetical protein
MSVNIGTGTSNIKEEYIPFTDWYLPSTMELLAMHDNLYHYSVGGFTTNVYWTSTEVNSNEGAMVNIEIGTNGGTAKGTTYGVRACRSFTSTAVYSLRNTGPANGLIFSITNLGGGSYKYYEASPSDLSTSTWSNITNSSVGTTGAQIGDGETNTTTIIGQGGHTDSAAKLCDDLVT